MKSINPIIKVFGMNLRQEDIDFLSRFCSLCIHFPGKCDFRKCREYYICGGKCVNFRKTHNLNIQSAKRSYKTNHEETL